MQGGGGEVGGGEGESYCSVVVSLSCFWVSGFEKLVCGVGWRGTDSV